MTNMSGTNLNSGPTAGPKGEEKGCPSRSQPYPEYKDSGVDWLGIVPSHWKLRPVYSLAKVINGYPFNSSLFDNSSGVPLVRIRDLGKKNTEVKYVGDFVNSAAITSDDVLIGMDGDFNVGRWRGEGSALLNQRMCCVRGNTKIITRYLEYWLPHHLKLINDITYSTTVKHLSSRQVEKLLIALPDDKNELSIIVAFLDRETQKIDRLIEKQQQLIKLLQEKRQAVISHAVTKGLNPSVKMKESGVEWLGEIPEHWIEGKVKYVVENLDHKRIPLSAEERGSRQGEYPYYGASGMIDYIDGYIFDQENILYGEDGANLLSRSTPLAFIAEGRYWVNNHAHILHPKDGLTKFWVLVLENVDITPMVSGSAQPKITAEALGNIRVVYPNDVAERKEISSFVHSRIKKIDALIEKCRHAIDLMKERRTALISAAVTGKIDVRAIVSFESDAPSAEANRVSA